MRQNIVDTNFYRLTYDDLATLSDAELVAHFDAVGRADGRVASPHAVREHFRGLIENIPSVLEIGPFLLPFVSGPNVKYFDILDTEGLNKRGKEINFPGDHAPPIDFVSPDGDLSVVTGKYEAVVSSHCLEHQPDLLGHLINVDRLLTPEGKYYLLIPDHRFCFDHFLPVSKPNEVLKARSERRRRHTLASVVQHVALTTHNDAKRHWRGDHAEDLYPYSTAHRARLAIEQYIAAGHDYFDVHAWQFTPDSFAEIIDGLAREGLCPLAIDQIHPTPRDRSEFTVILGRA